MIHPVSNPLLHLCARNFVRSIKFTSEVGSSSTRLRSIGPVEETCAAEVAAKRGRRAMRRILMGFKFMVEVEK